MLSAFVRAFRTPDLRRKLLFTLAIMALFRVGSFIPSPGVDMANVRQCLASNDSSEVLGMLNLFSGGTLLQLSVFSLGIMPYITASIIVQLLRVVIPRFEALYKEGQAGQTKLTQYTRYLTIGLAVLQSTTIVTMARSDGAGGLFQGCEVDVIPSQSPVTTILIILTMTAGTGLIMWMGELITERGVGNGMSLLIFTSIAAGFPSALGAVLTSPDNGPLRFIGVLAVTVLVIGAVVFVEQSQRRIPVQYAKRMVGRRTYGGSSTYIPLKINMAGVIPIIFASSLMSIPMLAAQFSPDSGWAEWILANFQTGKSPIYMTIFTILIIFFAFFYVSITFNPEDTADNMKKYGGFIPGIRAGKPTAEYLGYVINRITTPGSLYLAIVALIPMIALNFIDTANNIPFGGTSVLIVVGVGLETVKQIESQLQQRHYEGFLR